MAQVELGVHSGQQDIELEELRRFWRYCDTSGFDWISIWDHFYESPPRDGNGPVFEPIVALTMLAQDTERARIGCLVFCMGYRNPALLAKSLTSIDHLSHGRLEIGLGAGWHAPEHAGYGFVLPPIKERLDRLSEGVRVIRLLLTEERSNFSGHYYQLENAANFPRPLQARVPIVLGGGGETRSLRIAALRADGSNQTYMSADSYRAKNQVLDQWCEHYQRDPKTIARSVNLHFQMTSRDDPDKQPDQGGGLWGRPQQVIDQIGGYAEAGAQRVNIAVRPPLDWHAMQSYVEDVMPAFRV